jgi:hypothetical protein
LTVYQEAIASEGDETGEKFEAAVEAHVPLVDLMRVDLENTDPSKRKNYLERQADTNGFSKRFQNRVKTAAEQLAEEFEIK